DYLKELNNLKIQHHAVMENMGAVLEMDSPRDIRSPKGGDPREFYQVIISLHLSRLLSANETLEPVPRYVLRALEWLRSIQVNLRNLSSIFHAYFFARPLPIPDIQRVDNDFRRLDETVIQYERLKQRYRLNPDGHDEDILLPGHVTRNLVLLFEQTWPLQQAY